MRTIEWKDGVVATIDQTALPLREVWVELKTCQQVASALKEMKIRGAPLIGVAAAYGVALSAYHSKAQNRDGLIRELKEAAKIITCTRPTAVNLFWAAERILKKAKETKGNVNDVKNAVAEEAQRMADEDVAVNRRIGKHGSKLIENGDTVLTHCNAGSLATAEYGTALAPLYRAHEMGRKFRVYADETRPLLQGARLTMWELTQAGIHATLICDNMAAVVMREGKVNLVLVGADRIAANGDVANKIGTYGVAVLAKHHGIPFYVAAPSSTFDLSLESGDQIPIEERGADEVTHGFGRRTAPEGCQVYSPAFDVTPAELIHGIITERGLIERPNRRRIAKTLRSGGETPIAKT